MQAKTEPTTATADYRQLLDSKDIDAIIISATPETTHYPMAREFLGRQARVPREADRDRAAEADELIAIARRRSSSSRSAIRSASIRSTPTCASASTTARIGKPVSALVSRHITRGLGKKITGRSKLSPAAMESTHDLDFVLWCLEPAKPMRVYSQVNYGAMREATGGDVPDNQWIMVTHGQRLFVRRRRRLEPAAGLSEFLDDLDRDDRHRRRGDRRRQPSRRGAEHDEGRHAAADVAMPGEFVDHTYAGADGAPRPCISSRRSRCDRPVLVTAEQARQVMEVYIAADLSAERNEPVNLPLKQPRGSRMKKQPKRIGLAIVGAGPRRPDPRRARRAPSAGRLDRPRGAEGGPRRARAEQDAAPISSPPISASC